MVVRFLKDVEFAGKTFEKGSVFDVPETDGDLIIYGDAGHSRALKPTEVCTLSAIGHDQFYSAEDLDAFAEWHSDYVRDERKTTDIKYRRTADELEKVKARYDILSEQHYNAQKRLAKVDSVLCEVKAIYNLDNEAFMKCDKNDPKMDSYGRHLQTFAWIIQELS